MESSFLCHLPNSSQLKYCNVVISLQSNHRQLNRRIAARLSNEIYAKFWLNFQLGGVLVSSAFILLLVQQEWNNIRFQIGEQDSGSSDKDLRSVQRSEKITSVFKKPTISK